MKVLIIGGGGREHAIADAFSRSAGVSQIMVAPGNAGIAREYETLPLMSFRQQIDYCISRRPDLVFVGPEQPLSEGIADILSAEGIACIGPSKAAARIETSKIFAKDLMLKYGIPTAECFHTYDFEEAAACLGKCPFPLVIKADGLAAGKGVKIVSNKMEGMEALKELMPDAQKGVVIEEYLQGWEVSLFVFTDSVNFVTTLFSQDHKQLYDGDKGPNTGGMGAFAPVLEAEIWRTEIESRIIEPVLKALAAEGAPFSGVLYCGLMITSEGPKVVEFNCRLGDPEAQAVLPLLETSLLEISDAIIHKRIDQLRLSWKHQHCVAVVLASDGYPASFEKGFPIQFTKPIPSKIFYGGVAEQNGALITNGGRVLSVSAMAENQARARQLAYDGIDKIYFTNKRFRKDIGMRKNTL